MQYRRRLIFLVTVVITWSGYLVPPVSLLEEGFVYCPAYPCVCELDSKGGAALRVDCQRLYLTRLPEFLAFEGRIRTLSLKHNSIRQLPANAFYGLHVQSLDLTDNVIGHVHPGAFEGLEESLEELHMEVYAMEGVPSAAIRRMKKLRVLRIIGCKASTLQWGVFEGLDNLQELYLQECRIKTLEAGSLSSVKHLKVLNLEGNLLTSRALSEISNLYGLQKLVLSRNLLAHLSSRVFDHLQQLRYLDLSNNQVTHVDVDALKPLQHCLNILQLPQNQLTADIFLSLQHLGSLQQLMLGSNNITAIPKGTLRNLQSLTHLELSRNDIIELDKESLRGTENSLQVLLLEDNPLTIIHKDTFQQHSKLQRLTLDNSRLGGTLREEMFLGIINSTLKNLSISEAGLTTHDLLALSALSSLGILDVSRNNITNIPRAAFSSLHGLRKLNLSQNSIRMLPDYVFRGLEASLESVDLHSNLLSTVSSCVFDGFRRLATVRLRSNPLLCDCRLTWLRNWAERMVLDYGSRTEMLEWLCEGPEAVAGHAFSSLSMADLQCSHNSTEFRPVCNFNISDDDDDADGFEDTAISDGYTPSQPFPALDITKTLTLSLEVRPTCHGCLLALWNVTSTTTTITSYRLILHRGNDSKQEADMTLVAEVTQYLFTGLVRDVVYEVCVTALGAQEVALVRRECMEMTTTRGNVSATAGDKVLPSASPSHLPPGVFFTTPMIWSYASGSVVAVILCVLLVVVIYHHRCHHHHHKHKPAPGFNPGYGAWDGTDPNSSAASDDTSSICYMNASAACTRLAQGGDAGRVVVPRVVEENGESVVITCLDSHLRAADDRAAGENAGVRVWMQIPVGSPGGVSERRAVLSVADLEAILLESLASSEAMLENVGSLVDSDSVSERVGLDSLRDSDSTLEIRELEAFGEVVDVENPEGSLERRVFSMRPFAGRVCMEKMQAGSEGVLEMFRMESLAGCAGTTESESEVELLEDSGVGMHSPVAGSEGTLERIREMGEEEFDQEADVGDAIGSRDTLRMREVKVFENRLDMHCLMLASACTQKIIELGEGEFAEEATNMDGATISKDSLGGRTLRALESFDERLGKKSLISSKGTLERRDTRSGKLSEENDTGGVASSRDTLGRKMLGVGLSENRLGVNDLVSSEGTLERREPGKRAFDEETVTTDVADSSNASERNIGSESFEDGMYGQSMQSSDEAKTETEDVNLEALGVGIWFGEGSDMAVSDGTQSYRSSVSSFCQHLPASYFLTTVDIGDDVIYYQQ